VPLGRSLYLRRVVKWHHLLQAKQEDVPLRGIGILVQIGVLAQIVRITDMSDSGLPQGERSRHGSMRRFTSIDSQPDDEPTEPDEPIKGRTDLDFKVVKFLATIWR
jgi:hypothetical protein